MSVSRARLHEICARHPWAVDLLLIALVTAVAAALRLALLGDIPYGLHPDEAQVGTDARRVIEEGWIGVYTHAALGQPTGHAYLAALFVTWFDDTTFVVRLPLALTGIAAVPLLYALVRVSCGRLEAFFASSLLAVSYWHLLYSRVAHWSISYGTVVLAVLLCVMLGLQRRRTAWFIAAGGLLGLGAYSYNIYPIAVVAVAAFVVVMTLVVIRGSGNERWWLRAVACMAGAGLLVASPMLAYVSDSDAYYWEHVSGYSEVGVTRSEEFRDAGPPGKVRLLASQAKAFAAAYTYDASEDYVDGNGLRPVFDPLTLLLLAIGTVIVIRRRREPMVLAALCCIAIIPLPAVLQRGSIMRQPVAAAPFAMFVAALPLAALTRYALERRERPIERALMLGSVVLVVAAVTSIAVRDYFWTWRDSALVHTVYNTEITAASEYMRALPDDAYVYLYSDRHSLGLETVQFLAPGVVGENRSYEFSDADGSIDGIDRTRRAVFVLLPGFFELREPIERRYPGGELRHIVRGDDTEFYAYELPPSGQRIEPP